MAGLELTIWKWLMKVGDLVEWQPNFFDTNGDLYCSPGLILDSSGIILKKKKYLVMWSDGKITVEHEGYLKCLQKSE